MKKNDAGLIIQTVLSVAVIAFSILYFIVPEVLVIVQLLTALFMFVLAYNNHMIFKRNKYYTVAYIVIGLLILGVAIF